MYPVNLKYYCESLQQVLEVPYEVNKVEAKSTTCECCGTETEVTYSFTCKCGKEHTLELY